MLAAVETIQLAIAKKERKRAKSLLELSKSFIEEDKFSLELSKSIFEASELSIRKFASVKTIATANFSEFSQQIRAERKFAIFSSKRQEKLWISTNFICITFAQYCNVTKVQSIEVRMSKSLRKEILALAFEICTNLTLTMH